MVLLEPQAGLLTSRNCGSISTTMNSLEMFCICHLRFTNFPTEFSLVGSRQCSAGRGSRTRRCMAHGPTEGLVELREVGGRCQGEIYQVCGVVTSILQENLKMNEVVIIMLI